MMTPRQIRWQPVRSVVQTAVTTAVSTALGFGLLLPGAAAAAVPHTHARRPLPTALHSTLVTEGASPSARHKSLGKSRPGAHAAGATAAPGGGTHTSKARGKKRGKAEPADDPIPMYRVKHGMAPRAEPAAGHLLRIHGRADRSVFSPAPLPSTSLRNRRGEAVQEKPVAANRATMRAASPAPHAIWYGNAPGAHRPIPNGVPSGSSATTTSARETETFAQGVSHPEGDERLPREEVGLADTGPVPSAQLSAAPQYSAHLGTANQAPVVQGFGGEVAVPPSSADRPNGTRRRNHPANWVPEAMTLSSEPLDEREAITEAAVTPAVLPLLYDRNGRLVMPAPLKGSHDVLLHQNVMATSDGLERIQDDTDLDRMRSAHLLVGFPQNESLRLSDDLPVNRRCARPWTVAFASDTARAFYARFHQQLQVNSAVRTVSYQTRLLLINGNAAAVSGDAASPHLTGQAIDLAKRGMTQAQLAWMRDYLLPLMRAGKIDVEEEFQQACFHISVYRSYAPARRPVHEVAMERSQDREQGRSLAATAGAAVTGQDGPGAPDEQ